VRWIGLLRGLAIIGGLWCSHACALSVTLGWDADTGPNIVGYHLRFGTASGVYTQEIQVGNTTTATISTLAAGKIYYFAVTAFDASGLESRPSNEVTVDTGPLAVNDTAIMLSGTPVVINVLANDECPRGTPAVSQVTQPQCGTVVINSDNTVTYAPGYDFAGHDSFTYTLTDGLGGSSTATVTIADAGVFCGLITNASPTAANTGRIDLVLTHKGTFTGRLNFGSSSRSIFGLFAPDGVATVNIPIVLTLNPESSQITGSVTSGTGSPSSITASLTESTGTASQAGAYTLLIPAPPGSDLPEGTGFGRLVVTPSGIVRFTGRLADGALVSTASFLAADGTVSLYARLYGEKGFLSGVLKFESITTTGSESDLDGTLEWHRPQGGKSYSAGFDTTVSAIGSIYTPPAHGEAVADVLPAGQTQATVTLSGGNLTTTDADLVTAVTPNWLMAQSGAKDNVVIRINPSTGLFTGSFLDTATNTRCVLAGAVFQAREMAAGLFLTRDSGGSVVLAGE